MNEVVSLIPKEAFGPGHRIDIDKDGNTTLTAPDGQRYSNVMVRVKRSGNRERWNAKGTREQAEAASSGV